MSRIAYLLDRLHGVGTTIQGILTTQHLVAAGYQVDLVAFDARGNFKTECPEGVRVFDLSTAFTKKIPGPLRQITGLTALARYIDKEKPDIVISGANRVHLSALAGHRLATHKPKFLLTLTNDIHHRGGGTKGRKISPWLVSKFYSNADMITTVSEGLADDIKTLLPHYNPDNIKIIAPPVDLERIRRMAAEPLDHPWLQDKTLPVILGVGRFAKQKDLPTLIRAMGIVNKSRDARVIILGEGKDEARASLMALAESEGIKDKVSLPGFDVNPYRFMANADLFVLSSRWEGFGIVLAEALACGTSIVSTNCHYGPSQILDNGTYGDLVPVEDHVRMAAHILKRLDAPFDKDMLKKRADAYDAKTVMQQYVKLVASLIKP